MPSGRTHTHMTTALAVALAATGRGHEALGALAGVLLSPDLDVDAGYYGLHVMRVLAGDTAAKAWRAFWYGYARLVPHRSLVSHAPVVGTALRVAYLLLPALALAWLLRGPEGVRAIGAWLGSDAVTRAIVGLSIADAVHAVADVVVTAWRRG